MAAKGGGLGSICTVAYYVPAQASLSDDAV